MKKKTIKKTILSTYNFPEEIHNFDRNYWINKVTTISDDNDKSPSVFQFAPDIIKNDREINLLGLISGKKSPYNIEPHFYSDKEFLLEYFSKAKYPRYSIAERSFREDKELALAAYKSYSFCIIFFPNNLRYNKDFVLKLMSINGLGLEHISYSDYDICLTAVKQNLNAIKYIKDKNTLKKICNDTNLVHDILNLDNSNLAYLSSNIRNNLNLLAPYLDNNPYLISLVGAKINNNEEYMTQFCTKNKHNTLIPHYLGSKLKSNMNFLLKFTANNSSYYTNSHYATILFYKKNPLKSFIDFKLKILEFDTKAIQTNPSLYSKMSLESRANEDIIYFALNIEDNIQYIPFDLNLKLKKQYASIKETNPHYDINFITFLRNFYLEKRLNKNINDKTIHKRKKI